MKLVDGILICVVDGKFNSFKLASVIDFATAGGVCCILTRHPNVTKYHMSIVYTKPLL